MTAQGAKRGHPPSPQRVTPSGSLGRHRNTGVVAGALLWLRRMLPWPKSSRPRSSIRPSAQARLVVGRVGGRGRAESGQDSSGLAANGGLAALARALDAPDPALRARAVAVLCELGERRASEVLKTMLLDSSAMVRCAAIRSATRVRTTDVLASLIVALSDPDPEVRAASVDAVSAITGRRLSIPAPGGGVDPGEIEELKRWWREKRLAELEMP